MRVIVSLCFFAIALFIIIFQMVGHHGHLMFRPTRREDWIIWGLAVVFFLYGLLNLIRKKRIRK